MVGNMVGRHFRRGRRRGWRRAFDCALFALFAGGSCIASATNGTRTIAYGAASAQLAGSDVASGEDTSVVNTNPALLSRIGHLRFDIGGLAVLAGDVHRDALGNDQRIDNTVTPIAGVGYAQRLAQSGVVIGVGLFFQGGAGSVYKDLVTPFGNRDEYSSQYAVLLATLGVSYEISESLAFGASIAAVNGIAEQKLLPNTSFYSPSFSYFGLDVQDARSTRAGMRVGVRYRAAPDLAFGAYLSQKVDLPMSGSAIADLDAVGLGRVRYATLRIEGLGVPVEIAAGATWQVSERAELSAKIERILWSGVYRGVRYTASAPENSLAPPQLLLTTTLDWKDQTVFAAGLAYAADEQTTVRCGLNIGTRAGRPETTSPLLSGIDRVHVTAGFTRRFGSEYEASGGLEYLIPEDLVYTNPQQPFGPNAELRRRYTALHLAIARRW